MHPPKKFGVLAVAVFALGAIGAADASAANFTYSATGTISGAATETQVFTTNAGQVKCATAETTGNIVSTSFTEQDVTVTYKNCTAFGFANVHISPATYLLTANGQVHVKNTITINVTIGACHQSVGPQSRGTVTYIDNPNGTITLTPHITGIAYTTTPAHGSLCGTAAANGTFTGNSVFQRAGGGEINFDP